MTKIIKVFIPLIILFNIYLCSYSVLHHDIGYNTDIARDLLILQDIINNHKLPLIGPRTGGIDGLFHGPLWPYINLPAFILGTGNPVAIGWFWIFLISCSIITTYFVARKIFHEYVGLLSALILSLTFVGNSNSFLNPFGAVLISPLFFYFFYTYIQSRRIIYLLLTFFVIGLMIQFEVAFGGPMLVLSLIYLLFFLYKKKQFVHLFSSFILIIPLSTYILFDIRHNFLQLKSVLGHIGAPTGNGKETFLDIVQNRWNNAITNLMPVPNAPFLMTLLIIAIFIYIAVKSYRDKTVKYRHAYLLFTYLYLGYWPLSFYLNGDVQWIHIFPFVPLAIIIFSSSYFLVKKELFLFLVFFVLFLNGTAIKPKIDNLANASGKDTNSWLFNYQLSKKVFALAPSTFGYYVFTPDELGYGPKYAITYSNKEYPQKVAYAYTKKRVTFVILAPTGNGKNNNRAWWVKNKVKINKSPEIIINYANGYRIEKYILTNDEIHIPSDPNLIDDLSYR